MAKLKWGADGERLFEAGIDRGVLFLPGAIGVPWSGLRAVRENPSGGSPQPYYVDGYKYANVATAEEFNATLEAFTYPKEFALCDGSKELASGLFVTQQPRKSFGLSYRTKIGNDTNGLELGYKIHIVYNALAEPSSRDNASLTNTVDPMGLSWDISTRPPAAAFGYKPTAHFVVDSRYTPKGLLKYIEETLYGTDVMNSTLLTVDELITLFTEPGPYVTTNLFTNPSFETGSGTTVVRRNIAKNPCVGGSIANVSSSRLAISDGGTYVRGTITDALVSHIAQVITTTTTAIGMGTAVPGTTYSTKAKARSSASYPLTMAIQFFDAALAYISGSQVIGTPVTSEPVNFVDVPPLSAVAPANTAYVRWMVGLSGSGPRTIGDTIDVKDVLLEAAPTAGDFFYGGSPPIGDFTHGYAGTVNASDGVQYGVPVTSVLFAGLFAILSTEWHSSGDKSLRTIPSGASNTSYVYFTFPTVIGETYTVLVKSRLTQPQTGILEGRARKVMVRSGPDSFSLGAPNEAGVTDHKVEFVAQATNSTVYFFNGASKGGGDVWWDDFLMVKGAYTGDYYDGDSLATLDDRYSWSGVPHASTSIQESWNEYV